MVGRDTGYTPGYLVWRLSMRWRVAVDRALAPLELTNAKYALLSALLSMSDGEGPLNQRQLADRTGLESLYISKLARTLDDEGLVQRVRDQSDSRAVHLSLTAEGREVTRRAIKIVHDLVNQLLEPLGGLDGERTAVFSRELKALLDVPLPIGAPPKE